MEYLQTWLDNSEIPIITAFLLGLLTAVSPCPLATNITAIGFISKNIIYCMLPKFITQRSNKTHHV